jgi:hypothetical protein
MKTAAAVLALFVSSHLRSSRVVVVESFSIVGAIHRHRSDVAPSREAFHQRAVPLNLSKGDDDNDKNNSDDASPPPIIPKKSRIEGNQVLPTARDMEVMDEMITKLANAKPYELPNAVRRAFRVISSPRFFLRIATRTDMAADNNNTEEQLKLQALASNLVATLEAVVETTEEQLDERAKEVEDVVKAAAEPLTGEFLVPLLPQQVEEMRKKVEALEPSSLDETFLSTVDAWMMKSHEDGMDGMVGILQKVLQMYSGVQIKRARERLNNSNNNNDGNEEPTAAAKLLETLLTVDADRWDAEIRLAAKEQDVKPKALISEIQRTMETVVLGLENGSMAQRVQAEYLRELVTRAEAMQS